MRETKLRRVQGLPRKYVETGLRRFREPRGLALEPSRVKGIAQHGMTQMGHVDANLMGSSRLQPAGNEARFPSKAFDKPPMGHCMAAAPGRHHRDFFAARGVTGKSGVYRA